MDLLGGSELPARDRAECGRSAARLGDPRSAVTSVEEMELRWVPAGPFWMGSDDTEKLASYWDDREKPVQDYDVTYGYWIGRFPVTQAQFRVFVDDGGYSDETLWPEAGFRPDGPDAYRDPFGFANHPVVGVSWFEARAFCRWLTRRLRQRGVVDEGWNVELPDEPEWEKAARAGFKIPRDPVRAAAGEAGPTAAVELVENPQPRRVYPWTGELDAERLSYFVTGIGSTSAAGCFPGGRSPVGCEEMSGNVWEWTRSTLASYPYKHPEGKVNPDARFVLRGGSFDVDNNVRCAVRGSYDPSSRLGFVGFRVVFSPFSVL